MPAKNPALFPIYTIRIYPFLTASRKSPGKSMAPMALTGHPKPAKNSTNLSKILKRSHSASAWSKPILASRTNPRSKALLAAGDYLFEISSSTGVPGSSFRLRATSSSCPVRDPIPGFDASMWIRRLGKLPDSSSLNRWRTVLNAVDPQTLIPKRGSTLIEFAAHNLRCRPESSARDKDTNNLPPPTPEN